MIEKRQKNLDTGGHGSALLTDLSKDFYFIYHQLLIAKLNAYGLDSNFLYFLAPYLEKTKQRTNVNVSCSNFDHIFAGVPQGFILDPLLFNIYDCKFFFGIEDLVIASCADDKTLTPYTFSFSSLPYT